MKSAVFSAGLETYQVAHILYAGSVSEVPKEIRKGETTHSFRMVTTQGPVFCYYKSLDAAKKARGALGFLMDTLKENVFHGIGVCLDTKSVVSFGRVVKLKNSDDGQTHGFVVVFNTVHEKAAQIWLTYKSEEHAEKARKGLYAAIHKANNLEYSPKSSEEHQNAVAESECVPELG